MIATNWIAIDWGTSHLRTWKMSAQNEILDQRRCDKGMNSLNADQFEDTLIEFTKDWFNENAPTEILACGMVGSRQGWVEAQYLSVPCSPSGSFTKAPVSTTTYDIHVNILPGVKQLLPADVMRGEETQIAGLLVNNPQFTGVVCLPGTHSKWAKVIDGKITEFQTFLTGELFGLLSEQSVLRHSLDNTTWDDNAFQLAIEETLKHPQKVTAQLFSLRAESLVADLAGSTAYSRLSGLLIGLELANCQHYIKDKKVIIIGESTLSRHYNNALNLMGVTTQQQNSETMTLQGLTLAYQQLPTL